MQKLVSVIIPTYRRTAETVEKALRSVIAQSYKNMEIIIVDDNGNAEYSKPLELLAGSYPDINIKYICHDVNSGACRARNTGIRHSTGSYCAFLDDDDEWHPDKIALQVEKIEKEKTGMVYCGAIYINTKTGTKSVRKAIYKKDAFRQLLMRNYIGSNSCVLIRRECLEKCGMYDENLKSSQDVDLFIRIAKKYEISYIPEPLVNYYIHDGPSITKNMTNRLYSIPYLTEKYKEHIYSDKEVLSVRNARYVLALVKNRQFVNAVRFALRELVHGKLNPFRLLRYQLRN